MSRSYRKHDYIGICGGHHISEKYDKQIANRKFRHRVKSLLDKDPESFLPISLQEVSDIWSFNKDGKRYFGNYKKKNLETQKERLINYCNAKGYQVCKVIEEFGSGINDSRPKLIKLLEELDFTRIVVEHKDRLTRLGFNYLSLYCKSHNKEIEVVNNVDTDNEDIIQDFVSIITSYCARIYGKRRSKRKTEQLIREMKND